jgi:hypothetical protein
MIIYLFMQQVLYMKENKKKVDASIICESFEEDSLYDSHGFGYDVEIGGDFQKPFLKNCSTQKNGSILHVKALLANNEVELKTYSFWSK